MSNENRVDGREVFGFGAANGLTRTEEQELALPAKVSQLFL